MATVEKVVFESKWGFHPVSRETCAKLKTAHKLLSRAYRDIRKRFRWEAKLKPKTPEPSIPKELAHYGYFNRKGGTHYGLCMISADGSRTSYYHEILLTYQIARRPVESPELVKNVYIPGDLDKIIAILEEHYQ